MLKFPESFIFGVSASAYQIEGDNKYSDWWLFEEMGKLPYKSGKATDHWNRYQEDIELLADLGVDMYRFSIEWSRIYPEKDYVNYEALSRYREIVDLLRDHGIEPMLTLHHFTNPIWFYKLGGWEKRENIDYFINYVETIANEFSDVNYWLVFNEPIVYMVESYIEGHWPPMKKNLFIAEQVAANMAYAYAKAYEILHDIGKVSIAKNMVYFEPYSDKDKDVQACLKAEQMFNWSFIDGILSGKLKIIRKEYDIPESKLDFIGLNYYTGMKVKYTLNPLKLHLDVEPIQTDKCTLMGYCIYPRGLYEVLKKTWNRYGLQIIITENGVAMENDEDRILSIVRHLQYTHKALSEGVDVNGYFYWSILDNFEWDKGYDKRFGLVEVDYTTFKRKPRKSFYAYKEIIKNRGIPDDLLEKYGEKIP